MLQGGGPSKTREEGPRRLACLTSPLPVTPQTQVCMLSPLQLVGLIMFLFQKKSVRLKTVF